MSRTILRARLLGSWYLPFFFLEVLQWTTERRTEIHVGVQILKQDTAVNDKGQPKSIVGVRILRQDTALL